MSPIYLDHNATTPVDPRVRDVCLPYLSEHFGNPSSTHAYGLSAREAVGTAREHVAELMGCMADEVVFTAGGSDGVTMAIRGAVLANAERGRRIVTQVTEHPAVLAVCESLARLHGFHITHLPVNEYGQVDAADLESGLTQDTVLVSIMHANNETGTIQPIRELAALAHDHGALFHTDAAQSAGKIDLRGLGADLVTVAGHKMYAPKGIGALYVRCGLDLEPSVYGGGQERGRRGGTENVAFIVALGEAARIAVHDPIETKNLRDLLHDTLVSALPGRVEVNGHPVERLPNTLNISIDGISPDALLAATPGIAASTGSACHEGGTKPSAVLTAMGLTRSALRLTIGRGITADDIAEAAEQILSSVKACD